MNDLVLFILLMGSILFQIFDERKNKRKIENLEGEILALQREKRIMCRAQTDGLQGREVADLHDLVFRKDQNKKEEFEELFQSTTEKVRNAFRRWEALDE